MGSRSKKMYHKRNRTSRRDRELAERWAAEIVPRGSGYSEHGDGEYHYIKVNIHDGSTRVLSFDSEEAAHEACLDGMAADEARARARLDPDRPQA